MNALRVLPFAGDSTTDRSVENMDSRLKIAEDVGGTLFYHFSRMPWSTIALCGARTMRTSLPIDAWGTQTHLNERYCERCAELKESP